MVKQKPVKSVITQAYHFRDRGKPCAFNHLQPAGRTRKSSAALAFVPQIIMGHRIAGHTPCCGVLLRKFLRPSIAFLTSVVIKRLQILRMLRFCIAAALKRFAGQTIDVNCSCFFLPRCTGIDWSKNYFHAMHFFGAFNCIKSAIRPCSRAVFKPLNP